MKLEISSPRGQSEFSPRPDLGIITVGRQPGNDIALPEEKAASRKHFTIERSVDGWKLVDQMSANGTSVNGEKVNFAWLKDGDRITIGDTTLVVSGLSMAKAAVTGASRAAAKPVKLPRQAEAGEPNLAQERPHVVPAKKLPVGGFLVASFALLFVALLVYGAFASGVFSPRAPEERKQDTRVAARQAELAESEKALIAEAEAAATSGGSTLERIDGVDAVAKKVPKERASIVSTRIDEIRGRLLKDLESELSLVVDAELAAVESLRQGGDYALAIGKLEDLQGFLATNTYTKNVAKSRGIEKRVTAARTDLGRENEGFISGLWASAEAHRSAKRFAEALADVERILAGAWLKADERAFYAGKIEDIKAARDKAQAEAAVQKPEEGKGPDILKGIKKEDRGTLPGANPLLPRGLASEKELLAALQAKLVKAAVDKKLTSTEITYKGDKSYITGADKDRLFITAVKRMKERDGKYEEIPVGLKITWDRFSASEMLQLYDRVPDLDKNNRLATVIYALDAGLTDEGAARACKLYSEDNSTKQGLDILLASKRRIRVPEGGFVEFEGRLITPDEKEQLIFERKLSGVLERFERGLGSRDKKRVADSEAAYQELLALGERAVAPAIRILDGLRVKELTRVEKTTGLITKDSAKLKELKVELDKRRKHALELIMDEARYPYPYFTDGRQEQVQAEVNTRVAAVREIWDDPMSFTGQSSPDYEAGVERIKAINARMDELDKEEKFHKSTAEVDINYLKMIANQALNIRNFAGDDAGVKALLTYNVEVMAYNEAFPTGDGHTDAEGRDQVRITNEYRRMFERRALKINDKLFWAAKHHSRYCVEHNGGQIAHVIQGEPKGATPGERMKHEGYSGGGGENIHMNSMGPTAQSSHNSWCQSSGHHRNILHPMWKVLGSGKWGNIWTQVFGAVDEGDQNSVSKGGQD